MPKRYRVPKAKSGELRAVFGRPDYFDMHADLCYVNGGGGADRSDRRVLCAALEEVEVHGGKSLRQELEARGYDIETLRFSIQKKQQTA